LCSGMRVSIPSPLLNVSHSYFHFHF